MKWMSQWSPESMCNSMKLRVSAIYRVVSFLLGQSVHTKLFVVILWKPQSFNQTQTSVSFHLYFASVEQNFRFDDRPITELVIVLTHEFDGEVVRLGALWEPSHRIDALIGEVLIGLFAQQTKECQLNRSHLFVCYLKARPQRTEPPLVSLLLPGYHRLLLGKVTSSYGSWLITDPILCGWYRLRVMK